MKMMTKIGLRQSGKREVNELYEWCEKRQKKLLDGWKVKTALILCMVTQHESLLLIRKSTKRRE